MKKLSLFSFLLLSIIFVYAEDPSGRDTLSLSLKEKFLRPAKVGPENYFLPILPKVDPVQLRKLAIDQRYKQKAIDAARLKKNQASELLANLLSNTGLYIAPTQQNVNTLTQSLNSFRYAEDIKNQVLVLNTLGVYFVKSGEPEKSVGYFLQSLQLMEQLKDKSAVAYLAFNLGGVFKLMGNYAQALTYYEYSQKTNMELKRYQEVATAYIDIAFIKTLQKKYLEAEQIIFKKALPLTKWIKPGRMRSFAALGEIYSAQKRYSEAKWYYLQEYKSADFLNDQEAKISSLVKLAQIKTILGDQTQAISDYKEAERLASQNRYLSSLIEIKGNIGDIYLEQGDYASAGTAIDEYSVLKDSYYK